MGFAELLTVVAIFVGMPWATFTGIAKVKRASAGDRPSGADLKVSELEAIVARAAQDATAPLLRRIETLEAIVTDDEPARARLDPALLADLLETDAPVATAAARRRTRE